MSKLRSRPLGSLVLRLRSLCGGLTVAALILASAGCGEPAPSAPPAAGGGSTANAPTLVFGRGDDSKSLDPAVVDDGESAKVITNIFDTLVTFKPGTVEHQPGLASSWSMSPDGLVWTFTLRPAKFHDGTVVDADAVVFSFERQRDKNHPAHTDACAYWEAFFGDVDSVRAVDGKTVEIRLKQTFAPFESTMTLFSMSIVSPTAWKSEGIDPATKKYRYRFGEKPVGSGPFKFVRWTRGDTIVLERNNDWWGGAPKLGKLVFKQIKDNAQRLLALEAGQLDLMDGLNAQDAPRVKANAAMALDTQPGLNIAYLAFNVTKPPFDDPRVRQAVALAIDKHTLIRTAYDGLGEVAVNPMPQSLPYASKAPDRTLDRDRAKKLLAEAGHADGLSFKLNTMDNPRAYIPRPKDVAIQIQQDLAAIGVKVEIETLEWTRHREDVSNARHQACLLGWMADFDDADNFLYVLLDKTNAEIGSALNAAFYTDETVHEWLTAARRSADPVERERLYGLAQAKILVDAPMVPLVTMPEMRGRSKKVIGYHIYPAGGEYLAGVSIATGE